MTTDPNMPMVHVELSLAVARRQAEVARFCLSGVAIQARLGIDWSSLETLREDRKLLAIWHEPAGAWLYPDFQFERGGLISEIPEILAAFDRYYDHVWENTWSIMEWFLTPHILLDGRCPMDVISSDPSRVLDAARVELWEDPTTLW